MKITRDFVVQNLADSGLMSADDASSLCESLSSLSGPADSDTVAQELSGTDKLTAYQAQCVCTGETSGLLFGDYVVLEKIGQGGMGVVLKAQHTRMERIVAVKKLTAAALESEDLVKRFYREVKASARLLHPNVVTALDAREHEGVHYLIMEFIEGEDLSDVLKRQGPLPVDEAVDYVVQAAQGLEFAHKHGVFHRDIKPSNLMLTSVEGPESRVESQNALDPRPSALDPVIKILDMGLARIVSEAKGNEASRDQLTTDDQVMGTCDYMAPEQAENTKGVDHRADIYSLGCTLYRLLTNSAPYTGANLMQLLLAHRESPIPSICDKRPDVPASVDAVFQKMVAKTREERYQSMTEVIEALQAALGRGSAPAAAPAPDPGLMDFLKQIHDEPSGVSRGGRGSGKTDAAQAAVTVQEKADPITDETVDMSATADTDPSTSTRQPSTPAARPKKPATRRKKKQTAMLLMMGVGFGISLIGAAVVGAVLYVHTNYGTVVVSTHDEDVEVLVKRGGDVHVADAKNRWRIEVKSGKYSVELKGGNDRFVLDKDTITVTRGDEVRVQVELKPRPKPPRPAIAPFDTAQAKTHQKEWADYLGLPVERDFELPGGEKLTMMLIPPGEFLMGSTDDEQQAMLKVHKDSFASEGPQHWVRITRPFYVGKYEVTQAQWESVMGNNPSHFKGASFPVDTVKWHGCQDFLSRLNSTDRRPGWSYRLPTEAQWEYACRAGTTTRYHSGDHHGECGHSSGKTHPVGQLKANAWGLYDTHGNVREWCADRYAADYYGQSPPDDPVGPSAGAGRVLRGGGMYSESVRCRSASRAHQARYTSPDIGFRLACAIPYTPGLTRTLPAVSSSQPPAERPPATGPDGDSPPTGGDAAAPSTASLDDLPPWQLPPDAPKPAIAPFDAVQANEHQDAWADYLKLPVERDFDLPGGEKLTMRLIPPGDFLMGSTVRKQRLGEPHAVRISRPFYLGKYEVTQAEWEAVMGDNPSKFKGPQNPVERVSWADIQPFLAKLNTASASEGTNFKLPTEAQWEYACRAGSTTAFCFGDQGGMLAYYAWWAQGSGGKTHPVGEKKANGWDLHDMHGNVWEWCADWYAADYFAQSPLADPAGPKSGDSRVLRGGGRGKAQYPWACNSAYRHSNAPDNRGDEEHDHGFRLVCEIAFPPQKVGDPIDVLQNIDLDRDVRVGDWSMEDGALVVPDQKDGGRLRLPLEVDRAYQLEIQVVNFAGGGRPLGIMLPLSEGSVSASFDSHGNEHATGLELVDGKSLFSDDENETRITSMQFQRGVPGTIVINVQPDRIQAIWDGKTAIDWQGDQSRLSLKYGWPNPGGRGLYLSMYNGGFRFTKISYTPEGKPAEAATASSSSPAEPNASAEASQATAPSDAEETKPDEQAGAEEDSTDTVRTWTDTSGKTVEAAFVEVKDGMVRLRLPDGKIAEVPLERLCDEDQAYAAQQAERSVAP